MGDVLETEIQSIGKTSYHVRYLLCFSLALFRSYGTQLFYPVIDLAHFLMHEGHFAAVCALHIIVQHQNDLDVVLPIVQSTIDISEAASSTKYFPIRHVNGICPCNQYPIIDIEIKQQP